MSMHIDIELRIAGHLTDDMQSVTGKPAAVPSRGTASAGSTLWPRPNSDWRLDFCWPKGHNLEFQEASAGRGSCKT